jgi:hypothetical protein
MLLPRPYPDEVIGSILARGCRHYGLSWARFLQITTGRSPSSASSLMPFALEQIGRMSGMDAQTLLEQHTLFPYATAFMDTSRRAEFRRRALAGDDCQLSTLAHVAYRGTSERRVCDQCIKSELTRYGEAYWHRAHLLAGVHVCSIHGTPLRRTGTPLKGGSHSSDSLLPIDVSRSKLPHRIPSEVLETIALCSANALTRWYGDVNWLERFRMAAVAMGYGLRRNAVSSAAVAVNVHKFFGDPYLEAAGCPISADQRMPWPGLMVRAEYPTRFATAKFILMFAFFLHAPPVETLADAGYRKPGPGRRDYVELDRSVRMRMAQHLRTCIRRRKRTTVKELVHISGQVSSLHAFRDRFPLSVGFLREFRASRYAARRSAPRKDQFPRLTDRAFRRQLDRLAK